jgi:hypothetical protein
MCRPRLLLPAAIAGVGGALAWGWTGAPAARLAVPVLAWATIAVAVATVVLRFRTLHRSHLARVGTRAADLERSRLAAEMHDVLGHELALLATQAARLEMTPGDDPGAQAATIRRRTEQAVEHLHDVLRLLGTTDRTEVPGGTPRTVLDEAAAAGLPLRDEVRDAAVDPDEVDPVVTTALTGVLREALTNAARHAPGRPVTVSVERVDGSVRLVVENPLDPAAHPGRRSGLEAWDRKVRVVGGTLAVRAEGGHHRLVATFPRRADLRGHLDLPVESPPWLLGLAVPLIVVLAVVLGVWTLTSHGRTLSAEAFSRLQVGQPAVGIEALLPPSDALVVLDDDVPTPGGACRLFTDGALPIAQASFEVCLGDGRIVALRDLR